MAVYVLVAYVVFSSGEVRRYELSTEPLTWQQCMDDKAAMYPLPHERLACETQI